MLSRYIWGHAVSLAAAGRFSVHEKANVPLLDFPFLYQRLASFYAPFVPELTLSGTGPLVASFGYDLSTSFSYLPIQPGYGVRRAWSLESAMAVHWTFFERHRISAGALVSTAEYPIGVRTYCLPTFDYRVSLF